MGLFTSGLGAHLTWTLPFGLLIMFAVFNRFDRALRGGRARPRRDAVAELRHVVLPIIAPSAGRHRRCSASRCRGTRSRAPARRSAALEHAAARAAGPDHDGDNPEIYALGTITTAVSFAVIGTALGLMAMLRKRAALRASP